VEITSRGGAHLCIRAFHDQVVRSWTGTSKVSSGDIYSGSAVHKGQAVAVSVRH